MLSLRVISWETLVCQTPYFFKSLGTPNPPCSRLHPKIPLRISSWHHVARHHAPQPPQSTPPPEPCIPSPPRARRRSSMSSPSSCSAFFALLLRRYAAALPTPRFADAILRRCTTVAATPGRHPRSQPHHIRLRLSRPSPPTQRLLFALHSVQSLHRTLLKPQLYAAQHLLDMYPLLYQPSASPCRALVQLHCQRRVPA